MQKHLIIGASSGIGKALAEMLLAEGHEVYGTHHSNDALDGVQSISFDVVNDTFDPSFLPDTIDSFTYCPGAIDLKPFSRIKREDMIADMQLQVFAAVGILQEILTRLKKSSNASVLFFSTVAVQAGFNYHSQVAMSKGAIEGLSRSLAAELAPTVRVNTIAPSLTDTPLAEKLLSNDAKREANADRHPLKRVGTADDIAAMAAFLHSEKASWISGQVMRVDGGMSSLKI